MENTQHSDLLHLHPNGARSFCFDALGIVPRLARLLRILRLLLLLLTLFCLALQPGPQPVRLDLQNAQHA